MTISPHNYNLYVIITRSNSCHSTSRIFLSQVCYTINSKKLYDLHIYWPVKQ